MSKDIRSFFTVLSKKPGSPTKSMPTSKKRAIIDSDEDIVAESPKKPKKEKTVKKRKVNVLESDSEEEQPKKSKQNEQKKVEKTLKPVNALDVFGGSPIKQSKVEKLPSPKTIESKHETKKKGKKSKKLETELGIHDDDAFEKTLLELDDNEGLLENMDVLDKTINEALVVENNVETSKKRTEKTVREVLNESGIDPDQERYEKKRHSAMLYQKYLNRSGPAHHGNKEYPKGKPGCLKNLCFLRTGVLDSLECDEFDSLIKEHGGRTVLSVSKKVNYIVIGEEPGPAKIEKAKNYNIPMISEDELLDLILKKSGMELRYVKKEMEEETKPVVKDIKKEKESPIINKIPSKKHVDDKEIKNENESHKKKEVEVKNEILSPDIKKKKQPKKETERLKLKQSKDLEPIVHLKQQINENNLSWTEKYKPKSAKDIIGQQGNSSCMTKLMNWLQKWSSIHLGTKKPKLIRPSLFSKSDDGTYFKCALLSGPPGIGKTTTATLVAKELGFDVVEMNASDTRSKKLLAEEVSQLLTTTSLAGFFKEGAAPTKKHVLLMDEVDGMAGNEDRGGMQELIALIKITNIPIICMCNDRNHQKVRSLANYCYDLRFVRPRLEQIKGAMMSVCYKEGVKIAPDALAQVINGAGMDIRQILNNLSMLTASGKNISADEAKKEAEKSKKDTVLGPWDVCRMVFSAKEHEILNFGDKTRLFYYDYSLGPLFVQENYLHVVPNCPKKEILERAAKAADAISMGDIIDKQIRSSNNWSLLEVQSIFSSALPGHHMEGYFGGPINFPSWLGKNSRKNKFQRLLTELQSHMRLSASVNKESVNLDYLYMLKTAILKPLRTKELDGIDEALKIMNAYNLTREDLDSIIELSQWSKNENIWNQIDSKVKAAFTRAYNKSGALLPYSIASGAAKKNSVARSQTQASFDEEEENESDNDDDDINKDAMIKAKKKPSAKVKKKVAGTSGKTGSKGKGRDAKKK